MNKSEGYWRQRKELCQEEIDQVVETLPFPEPDHGWETKNPGVRNRFLEVLTDKESQADIDHFRGWSSCRICGGMNGSGEYALDGWRWPEGFRHYVEEHGVKPSDDFIEFVMG